MNITDEIAHQLQREKELNEKAFKKWKAELERQEKISDGSNTAYSRQWKKHVFNLIVAGLQEEINCPKATRTSTGVKAVKDCIGIQLSTTKSRKGERVVDHDTLTADRFDLELAVFVSLQITLDNSLAPEFEDHTIDKNTGKEKTCRPTVDRNKLCQRIGSRVEQQMAFKYIEECFPEFFQAIDRICDGGRDGLPKSSSYYWRQNMQRMIASKVEKLHLEGKHKEAEAMQWRPFGSKAKHVGDWLLSGLQKYGLLKDHNGKQFSLFAEYLLTGDDGKTHKHINLSVEADAYREQYKASHQRYIIDDQPMLCPPTAATASHFGSWLSSIHMAVPFEHKGELRISEEMLTYINRLQNVPYRINTFVASVMEFLVERNRGLGKFKPHEYEEPQSLAQALGLAAIADPQERGLLMKQEPDKLFNAKKDRSVAIARQIAKVQRGRMSRLIWENTKELMKLDRFYFPYQWDFRSRAYCRCMTSPQPQGTDYSKALLQFADSQPIDDHSKFYLAVEVANNAGMDKLPFNERVKWVADHIKEITLVATMMEPDGDTGAALLFLADLPDPWKFLAAAEEFYHCFIVKDRTTTSIRCGVDMSCSAAAIHAGWKRDESDAEAVNVTPSTSPQDIYLRVWEALLEVNKEEHYPLRPHILRKWTQLKHGRAAAKKVVMVFQYSAGIRKQMANFFEVHDGLPSDLQLTKEEIKALYKLWPKATKRVMSVQAVIAWFQSRVEEIYAAGKREVVVPNAAGCTQVMKYPLYQIKRVDSFHNGRHTERIATDDADLKAWRRSITANATHCTDGAILALALKDFDANFSTVHDAAYTYANGTMTRMLAELKRGYIEAVSFNIWDEFRLANGLPLDPATSFECSNTLDLNRIKDSFYIFA